MLLDTRPPTMQVASTWQQQKRHRMSRAKAFLCTLAVEESLQECCVGAQTVLEHYDVVQEMLSVDVAAPSQAPCSRGTLLEDSCAPLPGGRPVPKAPAPPPELPHACPAPTHMQRQTGMSAKQPGCHMQQFCSEQACAALTTTGVYSAPVQTVFSYPRACWQASAIK